MLPISPPSLLPVEQSPHAQQLSMQTRSSRRGHNQQFVQQYDRRLEQYRQDAKKRKATDSPSIALQPSRITRAAAAQHSDAVSSSNRARQQQQRGAQGTEENKEGNVIVLDDEEEEEEEEKKEIEEEESSQQQQQQQQKRRRLGSSNQASTSVYATPAVHSRTAASPSTAMSPRPPLRRPLLQSIASTIGRSISNTFELLTSPFSSTATHYTRHKPNTRSTRHTNNPNVSPPSSIAHSSTGRDASLNDDIDRTFRLDDRAFHDSTAYLTYPPHAIRQSVTVTYGDLHRLNPNEFLNDTLIEFYLLYIRDRVVPQRLRGSFHFFNSFLFTRLSEYGSDGVREVYQHVKGWTKGVNLFEKDWIVMPINDADRHHWSLVIIAHPGRAMRPSGMSNIGAALTADRAKQKQQLAGGGARRADSRAILRGGASVQGQKRNNAATPSPTQASLGSSTRLPPRNGKLQQSIPDLFALHNTAPPPSSLFALSAPPLTVPKPAVKPTRSLRPRSHGEELALLIQQQQPNSVKLVTRSSLIDALMSPDNQTTRRLTESKGNIRASMHHSPYSKQQRSDDYLQRKQEDEWRRAIAVPDEQPITSDTQHAEVEEEWTEEEGVQPAAAVSSAGRAAGVLPPQYIADLQFEDVGDDVGDVEEHAVPLNGTEQKASSSREISTSDEVDQGEKPQQQAADAIDDEFDFDDVDADEAGLAAPRLPRIADSVPPTLPLPTQTSLSSSPSATSASDRISEADEAGWRPCILHLDSLPIPPSQTKKIANILREYLHCEWEHQQQLHGIPQPASQLPPPPPSPSRASATTPSRCSPAVASTTSRSLTTT